MKLTFRCARTTMFIFLVGTSLAFNAFAGTLTVGREAGCSYDNLQSAIDNSSDGDQIRISSDYVNLHLQMRNRSLRFSGGFMHCTDTEPLGQRITLSGSGGSDSALLIDGSARVILEDLNFGDTTLDDTGTHGAAINYRGHGSLTLTRVGFAFNTASYGGALNVSADGAADIFINEGTVFIYNTAYRQGGAINIEGDTHLYMLQPRTLITSNSAGSDQVLGNTKGGGMQINGPAVAEIGAPSNAGDGAISRNTADYGGGIAVEPGGTLRLFSSDASDPVTVAYNTARRTGGGIHTDSDPFVLGGQADLCGFVYKIDHNTAKNGAAIYADGDSAGLISLETTKFGGNGESGIVRNCAPVQATEVDCPPGVSCNTIDDNVSTDAGAATIVSQNEGVVFINTFEMRHNISSHGFVLINPNYTSVNPAIVSGIYSCLISDNTFAANVVDIDSNHNDHKFEIHGCTIALNALDAGVPAIASSEILDVRQSILWQPSNSLVFSHGGGTIDGRGLIVSDSASFPGVGNVTQVDDPGFIEPSNDYHLRHDSPAVDYLPLSLTAEQAWTLDSTSRGIHLDPATTTPFDAGAYERQTIPAQTFPGVETFEELDPTGLELPTGWSGEQTGANLGWFVTDAADGGAHAVHTGDPGAVGQAMLTSPAFVVPANSLLRFRHAFQLEATYDVAVLEISIDGAPFVDIIDAGGRFEQGGYNMVQALGAGPNPIGPPGRPVWSGDDGTRTYQTVVVDLPPQAEGRHAQIRWHVGSDASGTHNGYWLDTIELLSAVGDEIFADGFDNPAN